MLKSPPNCAAVLHTQFSQHADSVQANNQGSLSGTVPECPVDAHGLRKECQHTGACFMPASGQAYLPMGDY
jgi:hypothetical protein